MFLFYFGYPFRINGFVTTLSGCGKNSTLSSYCTTTSLEPHDILSESETSNLNSTFDTESLGLEDNKYFQIKDEPQDDFEHKNGICSIIGKYIAFFLKCYHLKYFFLKD